MSEFERFLSDSLKSVGETYEPHDVYGAKQKFFRRRRRRRWTLGAAGVVAAGAIGVLALFVVRLPGDEAPPRPARPGELALTDTVSVGAGPAAVAVGYGAAWVANSDSGTVSRIDLSTHEVVATIGTGGTPDEITVGAEAVWVTNRSSASVQRIDPETDRVVDDIQIGLRKGSLTLDLAFGPEGVWVAALQTRDVWLIDPVGSSRPRRFADRGTDVAADATQVWVMDAERGRLRRLAGDGPGPDVVHIPRQAANPNTDLAVGFGALWVALGDAGTVTRIDLATGEDSAAQVGGGYSDLAVGPGDVWALTGGVSADEGELVRLDPESGAPVGRALSIAGAPIDVAADSGYVWVAQSVARTASRIQIGGDEGPTPEPEPSPSERSEGDQILTMWPELTEEQREEAAKRLRAGEDPWRRSSAETALHFARDIVGWVAPQLRAKEGSVERLGQDQVAVSVFKRGGRKSPTAEVILTRCIENRWWCVTGVGDPDPDGRSFLSVSVQGRRVQLAFPEQRAEKVVLQIGYGDVATITQEMLQTPFSPLSFKLDRTPRQPGFLMLRWYDRKGRVFSAQGTTLPAGDFSAG